MDKNKYTGCDNQPKRVQPITSEPSGADGRGWNPGAYSLTRPHMQGNFPSYPPDLNCNPDSKFDGNLINVKSEMSEFCRESELYPEVSTRGLDNPINGSNSAPFDCLMDTNVNSVGFMNFMPPTYEASTYYPIKEHGAEAKNSSMSRFQRSGNFSSSECSTSLLPPVYNFGTINDNIGPFSFNNPHNDGNFLTLGIGSGIEFRPNSNFSTREISSTLERAYSDSHCSHSHSVVTPMNPTQLMGRGGRTQTTADRLSSSSYSLASRMPIRDERELIGDGGFRLNSIPPQTLQASQAYVHPNFSAKCFSSGFGSSPLSLPFGSTFASQPIYGQQDYSREASMKVSSESSRNFPSQWHNQSSISHLQLGNLIPLTGEGTQINASVNFPQSVQPARNLTPTAASRTGVAKIGSFASSVGPVGNLTATAESIRTEAAKIGSFASSVRPVELGNYIFPERNEFQNSEGGTSQSAAAGPFPKRLGLQSNDFVTARTPRGPPFHLASPLNPLRPSASTGQYHHGVTAELSKDFPRVDRFKGPPPFHMASPLNPVRPSASTGPPPFHMASPLNPVRPSASTGQYQHGVTAELSKDFPRVDRFKGIHCPGQVAKSDVKPRAAPAVSHSSLKRKATKHPTPTRSGQLRKNISQHITPVQKQSIQTTPRTVHVPPTSPLHVKWQGFDEERPEPRGENCYLCKRDLSFSPEGLVFQPTAPPQVAVLECGHVFHDHCLQKITPEDQQAKPPCIPCAIGGT